MGLDMYLDRQVNNPYHSINSPEPITHQEEAFSVIAGKSMPEGVLASRDSGVTSLLIPVAHWRGDVRLHDFFTHDADSDLRTELEEDDLVTLQKIIDRILTLKNENLEEAVAFADEALPDDAGNNECDDYFFATLRHTLKVITEELALSDQMVESGHDPLTWRYTSLY